MSGEREGHHRRSGEVRRAAALLARSAVVAELARPVPMNKGKAWLCLEPLPADELARRRELLESKEERP